MGGEIEGLIKVWISGILGLCYCYYITSTIPKGFLRLVSLLPIFYLFLNLSSSPNNTPFFLFQLSIFHKLTLFSFNHGPLALSPTNNIVHFIFIASLPIIPKQHPTTTTNVKPKWLLPLKVLIFAIIARVYDYNKYLHLHTYFILVLYCCHLYLALEFVFALIATPVRTLLGLDIEPHFNEPYLSTSLQDYWGRRWNLTVTYLLRSTVYDPVRRISTGFVGPSCATLASILATFLVSGLLHELIYYHITRAPPTWEVTCFFVLHGVSKAVEVVVKKAALRRGWQLHRAVSGPLVVAFLAVTANWLFLPQLLRNGMDKKFIQATTILMDFFFKKKSKIRYQ